MLGLPSTTEVGRVLPKKAFYERYQVSPQVKDDFVRKVEHFEIAHSIKPSTTNIPAGANVPEVLVLRVELRQREVPEVVLKFVAEKNSHKLLFACEFEGEVCLAVLLKKLVVGEWRPLEGLELDLRSDDMDAFWDSLASQVVYGDAGLGAGADAGAGASATASAGGVQSAPAVTVEERFARDQKLAALREEIARLDARCRKEKQINKKNQLFSQVKQLKAELAALEKEVTA